MFKSNISDNLLYHFTKNLETVVSILENGFYPMTAIEDISFMLPNYEKAKVGIPMVCFTDIPIKLLGEHREEYGQYGICMKKEWGISKGINPILYIIKGTELYNAFNNLQKLSAKQGQLLDAIKNTNNKYTLEVMRSVMNFAGFMRIYSEDDEKKPFYDEREWRYLPPFTEEETDINGFCNRIMFDQINDRNAKEALNKKMKELYPLKFTVKDVEKIIVVSTEDSLKLTRLLYDSNIKDVEDLIKKIVIEEKI